MVILCQQSQENRMATLNLEIFIPTLVLMRREFVRSRSIKSIGYENDTEILEIEFRSGPRVYQYYDVPHQIYVKLMTAQSKGKFVNQVIKSFPCQEIFEESSGSRGKKPSSRRVRDNTRRSRRVYSFLRS